jgi:predicted HTH domain antitoxin
MMGAASTGTGVKRSFDFYFPSIAYLQKENMTLTIPDEILSHTNISSIDMRIEVAAYLYEKQRISIGKARLIAGLSLIQFQKELAKRNIYLQISSKDLDTEVKNLRLL